MTKLRAVLSQKYSGDINIFPETPYADLPRMLKNPTTEFVRTAMERGERATWPRLTRVRNHLLVELELDRVIHDLRARVVFEPGRGDKTGAAAGAAVGAGGGGGRTRGICMMRSPRGFGAAGAAYTSFNAGGVSTKPVSASNNGSGRKPPRRRHQTTGTEGIRPKFINQHQLPLPPHHPSHHHRRAKTATSTTPTTPRANTAGDYFTLQPDHSTFSTSDEEEGEGVEPVANSGRKRFAGWNALVISIPTATSVSDGGRALSSRRGRELVRMTRVAGEFDAGGSGGGGGVRVGIGRAKSAEELRGFRG